MRKDKTRCEEIVGPQSQRRPRDVCEGCAGRAVAESGPAAGSIGELLLAARLITLYYWDYRAGSSLDLDFNFNSNFNLDSNLVGRPG